MNRVEWKSYYRDIRIRAKEEAPKFFAVNPDIQKVHIPYLRPLEAVMGEIGIDILGDFCYREVIFDKNGEWVQSKAGSMFLDIVVERGLTDGVKG